LKKFPETYYYIVGRDVNNTFLKQLAEEFGVESRVIFIPPIASHFDLCYYYKNADIFMLLSENQPNGDVEGFGIVALEANYFRLPVIGAKGCGVEDAVLDGFSGFLVDSKNPKEIVNSLQLILENGDKFNENAKKHALDFGWNEIVKQYEEILCAE
jgi:phosphatidylinositol alpha-1,6-mannosyltransferase